MDHWKALAGQLALGVSLFAALPMSGTLAVGPTRVYILAGQSNMQGHAKVETFDYIGDDPNTAPLLREMRGPDGSPRVCDGVWISYLTGIGENNGESFGPLTAGYGARRDPAVDGGKIGPEFTFGIRMDQEYEDPVLIIKTAWGGKSLFYDFRPPSAGPYTRTANDIEKGRNPPEDCGHYYRTMIEHVREVLKDIKRVCPAYDESAGYELAGFVWFQGWNDMVNRNVYPLVGDAGQNRFAKYGENLAHLIRDVRRDLETPHMPFVIGVMGVGGKNPKEHNAQFREAMAAPVADPEFAGSVVAVQTSDFWDETLGAIDTKNDKVRQMAYFLRTENKNHANKDGTMTKQEQREYVKKFEAELITPEEATLRQRGASNAAYHYLGCAKTFARMGQAFAEAIISIDPPN